MSLPNLRLRFAPEPPDFVLSALCLVACLHAYSSLAYQLAFYYLFPFGKFLIREVRSESACSASGDRGDLTAVLPLFSLSLSSISLLHHVSLSLCSLSHL
jgi:hypothetical protein